MNEFLTNLKNHPWILLLAAAVIGYLIGSLSTARVVYFFSTGSTDYLSFSEINPIYHRFKGGRLESPMMGTLFVVNWFGLNFVTAIASIPGYMIGIIMVLRWSLFFLLIFWFWFYFHDVFYVIFMALANFLFWFSIDSPRS